MSFEKSSLENSNSLYPERAFLRIDSEIDRIKKIESGEIKKLKLSESERENVLEFENSLGEELEKINDIGINSTVFYPEYFLTEEGRADFLKITDMPIEVEILEDIEKFILKNRNLFNAIDSKSLSVLAGESRIYCDNKLVESLQKTLDEDGNIKIEELTNPVRLNIILNPDEALEKIQRLRQFKKEVSITSRAELVGDDNMGIAREKIRNLYRKKTNIMIVEQAYTGIWAAELANSLGEENLTQDEKNLKRTVPGLLEFEEIFSKYDRFVHGADANYDEKGMRKQVGVELLEYANRIDEKFIEGELARAESIREKGLDMKKIDEKNIVEEEFTSLINEMLELYGQKSEYPASDYDNKRNGAAPDNKWQFVARKEYSNMSVKSEHKIIKAGVKEKSIVTVLATLLGHEYTHFIQALNRDIIPMRLFAEKMDTFRSELLSEGGAMAIENDITKELFGYEKNPKPHYTRAMAKKLEGGTYLECVEAYLESSKKSNLRKKELGLIEDDDFKKELEGLIKTAISATKRLFRVGDNLDRSGPYLTKSKDTVYAEQIIVMEKLRKNGLENCAFIKGVNLDTLATLMEMGLIDLADVKKPNLDFIRKVWEEKKSSYKLEIE